MKRTPEESLDFIISRRSVFPKEFEEGMVSKEEITQLLEAARWAPTHKVTEPWNFQVFMGDALEDLIETQVNAIRNKLSDSPEGDMKEAKIRMIGSRSSAVIAVLLKRDEQERVPQHEEEWSVATAVQNIHIHAASLDIGMYWSTGAARASKPILELLEIEEKDLHMGWLYLGRYTGTNRLIKERKKVEEYVVWR